MKRFTVALLAALAALACGRERGPAAASDAAEPVLIRVRTSGDVVAASFRLHDGKVRVEFEANGAHLLVGEPAAAGRRFTLDGAAFGQSKPEGAKIALTAADGSPRWLIQPAGKRIRLGTPAEGERYVLVHRDDDRIKVLAGTAELGRVTFERGEGRIKVRQPNGEPLYHTNAQELSAAFGVLLLPDLAPEERFLIMAELLAQNL